MSDAWTSPDGPPGDVELDAGFATLTDAQLQNALPVAERAVRNAEADLERARLIYNVHVMFRNDLKRELLRREGPS